MSQDLDHLFSRAQQELSLQTALGSVFIATKGYGDEKVEQTYAHARTLCQRLENPSASIPVLAGLGLFYLIRADHHVATELGAEALRLAEATQVSDHLLSAHYVYGQGLACLGQHAKAREHLRRASEYYDAAQHHALVAYYGEDPGVVSLVFEALTLFALGYPDQALQRSQEAITLAEALGHEFSLIPALLIMTIVRQYRREPGRIREESARALALAEEREFPFWVAFASMVLGAALCEEGDYEQGITLLREGFADYEPMEAGLYKPDFLGFMAAAEAGAGQIERGLSLIDRALTQVAKTDERWREPELHRLKGELTLKSAGERSVGTVQQASEACFQKALEVARHQDAKSWELRAATYLARLWQQQDKKAEAHQLLFEIYEWFTEGFDTKDLQDAKALLEELG